MLKETETEETIAFFVTFVSLETFQLMGVPWATLATPMYETYAIYSVNTKEH